MRLNRFLLFLLIIISITFTLPAQQITKSGVVDINRIFRSYFRESKPYKDLENFKKQYEDQLQKLDEEILKLEQTVLETQRAGNESLALELEQTLYMKKQYRVDYQRVKAQEYQQRLEKLTQSSNFWRDILQVIDSVAIKEGYSIILRASDPYLLYYNKEVDITDEVLKILLARSR